MVLYINVFKINFALWVFFGCRYDFMHTLLYLLLRILFFCFSKKRKPNHSIHQLEEIGIVITLECHYRIWLHLKSLYPSLLRSVCSSLKIQVRRKLGFNLWLLSLWLIMKVSTLIIHSVMLCINAKITSVRCAEELSLVCAYPKNIKIQMLLR